jgi:F0F1-type ATP synthase membrane subunit c/vacuolar-type H+-ATPase subunit K
MCEKALADFTKTAGLSVGVGVCTPTGGTFLNPARASSRVLALPVGTIALPVAAGAGAILGAGGAGGAGGVIASMCSPVKAHAEKAVAYDNVFKRCFIFLSFINTVLLLKTICVKKTLIFLQKIPFEDF